MSASPSLVPKPVVVDFHTHAFPDAIAPVALEKLSASAGFVPHGDGTIDGLLSSMDRCGVAVSVVHSIATSPRQVESIRRWALAIRSPRIVPFPSVHPDSRTVREELATIARDGFLGIKLHPEYQSFAFDDEKMLPLYETCQALHLIVFFHAGDDSSFPRSDRGTPRRLAAVRAAFPDLTIIAAHTGGWRQWEEVGSHLLGQDLYLEISFTRTHLSDSLWRDLLLGHSPDRLLFGSDYPWDEPGEALRHLETLRLSEHLLDGIRHGNAELLLRR